MSEKKVLVVEDDADLLRGMRIRLAANGYQVCVASDAVFAVSTARREKPDVILMDIGLPAGDGFLVMERLKGFEDLERVPFIVITAREPSVNRKLAEQEGAFAYFQKPFDNEELLATIRKALDQSGQQLPV